MKGFLFKLFVFKKEVQHEKVEAMKDESKKNWGEFCSIFGVTPRNRILEFLLEGRELDFSIGDISSITKLNRATTYNTISELIKEGFVIESRKSANAQLYKLNFEKHEIKLLINIFNFILEDIVKQNAMDSKEMEKSNSTNSNVKNITLYMRTPSITEELNQKLLVTFFHDLTKTSESILRKLEEKPLECVPLKKSKEK